MIKKLSLYTTIMLLIPVITWLANWHWSIAIYYPDFGVDYLLFLLTETGSTPYAFITSTVFILVLVRFTRQYYSPILVIFVCVLSITLTQAIKSSMKSTFKEPRPFVSALFPNKTDEFYQLPRKQRSNLVLAQSENKTHFVTTHHAKEVGYSFPSGHTIFAVSWLLLFVGFCVNIPSQGVIFLQIFATIWAALMLVSRLRLGMHYPIDLFASTLIAWGIHLIIFLWIVPWLEKINLFNSLKKRS